MNIGIVMAISTGHPDSGGTGTISLVLSAFAAFVSVVAIGLALLQTYQLRGQVKKLESTQNDLSATRQAIETQLNSLTGQMYEVLGISQTAHQVPRLFQQLGDLANNYALLHEKDLPFIKNMALRQLEDLITNSTKSSTGVTEIVPRDVEWVASELIDLAEGGSRVMVTSYVNTTDFWSRPSARDYLTKNRQAIERGVTITRVFLFDSDESYQASQSEVERQCAAGIDVRTALTKDLDEDLARDMFLLDELLAAEFVLTPGKWTIREVRVWYAPNREVRETHDRMMRLLTLSEPRRVAKIGQGDTTS